MPVPDARPGDARGCREAHGRGYRRSLRSVARVKSFRERIRAGALTFPGAGKQNLTIQHNRELPVGLLEFMDSPGELRFRATLAKTPRADQLLMDIDAGHIRGASMEFYPERVQPMDAGGQRVMEITKGRVSRVSLVDVPAYPSSRFAVRAEGEPEPEIRILPGPGPQARADPMVSDSLNRRKGER